MKHISFSVLLILLLTFFMSCSSFTGNPDDEEQQGGGTETVIGVVKCYDNSLVSSARVFLYPSDYNPVADKPLDKVFQSVTDNNGRFTFGMLPEGFYNLYVESSNRKEMAINYNIAITNDKTVNVEKVHLQKTGSIKVLLPDTISTSEGFIYLKGTGFLASLKNNTIPNSAILSVLMKNIPAGIVKDLEYYNEKIIPLQKSVTVEESDTTIVDVSKDILFSVKGHVDGINGVELQSIRVHLIPSNYNPLTDSPIDAVQQARVRSDGSFVVKSKNKGRYSLYIFTDDYRYTYWKRGLQIETNNTTLPQCTLRENGTLRLVISTDDMGIENGTFYVEGSYFFGNLQQSKRMYSSLASYELKIPASQYEQLSIRKQDGNLISSKPFSIESARKTTVDMVQGWIAITKDNCAHLATDSILSMAIDRQGVQWFGTARGLYRLENYEFTQYTKDNSDLPHDLVFSVEADIDGSLWVGTAQGLAHVTEKGTWKVYTRSNSLLRSNRINEIVCSKNRGVWIGTSMGAINVNKNRNWKHYDLVNTYGMKDNRVYAISVDSSDVVWLGNDRLGVLALGDGFYRVYGETHSIGAMYSILSESQNRIWFGTSAGLSIKDGDTWYSEHVEGHPVITAMTKDEHNNTWLGTQKRGTIYIYDGTNVIHKIDETNSPLHRDVARMSEIIRDSNNRYWITTLRGGIFICNDYKKVK